MGPSQAQRPVLKGRFVLSVFFSFSIRLSSSTSSFFPLSAYFPFPSLLFFYFFDVTLGIAEVIVALATPCGRPGTAHIKVTPGQRPCPQSQSRCFSP